MKFIGRKECLLLLTLFVSIQLQGQSTVDKVKGLFGKSEPSRIDQYLQQLRKYSNEHVYAGSKAEVQLCNYIGQEFSALLYKPYLGKYVHRFSIDDDNNLSGDSYIKIFKNRLAVGKEVIIPPFSGTGQLFAQALPGMQEVENLWFIKFSDVGVELNNKHGNGAEKLYRRAKEAFAQGAEAVMFVNDDGTTSDFTNKFLEKKVALKKPVFILNHAAYKKYILEEARGKEWIDVDYNFSKTRLKLEGHNVIGYWQNQSSKNIVIAARLDELSEKGKNTAGLAALLLIAERINKLRPNAYNYILVGISGTNEGRIGANHLIQQLRLNANNTSAVIHIDDIASLPRTNELYVSGTGTSPQWKDLLATISRQYMLKKIPSGEVGNSNHRVFYENQIPAINFFTKRKNNIKSFNKAGINRIATSIGDLILALDKLPSLTFTKTQPLPDTKKLNFNVSMGITPDYEFDGKGLLIGYVKEGSSASISNVMPGDVLIRMDFYDIRDVNDYVRELAKYKKGDRIMISVLRNGVAKKMLITFK